MSLSPLQYRGINALLVSRTQKEAAAEVEVTEATMSDWMSQPEFRKVLQRAEDNTIRHTERRLNQLSNIAVDRLRVELDEAKTSKDRLVAADKILTHLLKYRDEGSSIERIKAMETILDESSPANHEHQAPDHPLGATPTPQG